MSTTTVFEEMGVDFEFLTRRYGGENGIASKQAELTDMGVSERKHLEAIIAGDDEFNPEIIDTFDKETLLEADLLGNKKLARQEAAHRLDIPYKREYIAADGGTIWLLGSKAIAWMVINQVLNGSNPDWAASQGVQVIQSMENGEDRQRSVLVSGNSRSFVVAGAKLDKLRMEADLSAIDADEVGFADSKTGDFLRFARPVKPKWDNDSVTGRGVDMSEYPARLFDPGGPRIVDSLGVKCLVGPQAITEHFLKSGEFERVPELGLVLQRQGIISLDETLQHDLSIKSREAFDKALPEVARQILYRVNLKVGDPDLGRDRLLVGEILTAGAYPGSLSPSEALKKELLIRMSVHGTVPDKSEELAWRVVRRSDRKQLSNEIKSMATKLNIAVANPDIPKVQTHPEFVRSLLDGMYVQATTAAAEGRISGRAEKRIKRFVDNETKKYVQSEQ